jgi:hypothetical protein
MRGQGLGKMRRIFTLLLLPDADDPVRGTRIDRGEQCGAIVTR